MGPGSQAVESQNITDLFQPAFFIMGCRAAGNILAKISSGTWV